MAAAYNVALACAPGRTRLLPLVLLAGVAACRGPEATDDPVLLKLGAERVHRSDFEAHVHKLESRGGTKLEPAVRSAVLTAFLEERVLVLEARARGLLTAGADDATQQAATRKLLHDQVLSKIVVDETLIATYYQEHPDEFRLSERRTLRQVLLATEREARDTRRRLERDPKELELLARSRSRGPEAQNGGLMGTFGPGELPSDLEAAAFALAPGQISPVVASGLGFHVLRLDAREPARQRSLDESRDVIRARLWRRAADENVRLFVRGLLARAEVNHDAANPALPAGR